VATAGSQELKKEVTITGLVESMNLHLNVDREEFLHGERRDGGAEAHLLTWSAGTGSSLRALERGERRELSAVLEMRCFG
jgi:hypothetical protein